MKMKTYNLFLDDVRNPKDCCQYMPDAKFYFDSEFVIVRNYDEFGRAYCQYSQ